MSLDALRGFDMFWIIGGGAIFTGLIKVVDGPLNLVRPQFEHARWEGLHFHLDYQAALDQFVRTDGRRLRLSAAGPVLLGH